MPYIRGYLPAASNATSAGIGGGFPVNVGPVILEA